MFIHNRFQSDTLLYPCLKHPRLSLFFILALGGLNLFISSRVIPINLGLLVTGMTLHLFLNYIYRKFPTFYPLLQGKFTPPTMSLEDWFERQKTVIFANWKAYLAGIIGACLFAWLAVYNIGAFTSIIFFSHYIDALTPLPHLILFIVYGMMIFFIIGIGLFIYLQLLLFLLRLKGLAIAEIPFIFFKNEVDRINTAFIHFTFGGIIPYVLWTLLLFRELFYVHDFGIPPIIPVWTTVVGGGIILYVIVFKYILHAILVKFKRYHFTKLAERTRHIYDTLGNSKKIVIPYVRLESEQYEQTIFLILKVAQDAFLKHP